MSTGADGSRAERAFRTAAGRSPRMFWLDGWADGPWRPDRSVIGTLSDADVSLTYDATAGIVTRHRSGRSDPVGDDIFTVLEEHLATDAGDPDVLWVGYLGYGCRPDLPARPAGPGGVPDAVWMRVRRSGVQLPPHSAPQPHEDDSQDTGSGEAAVPEGYAAAYAEVQRQLRRGNSYEVNLTYRDRIDSDVDPVAAYLRLRRLNPAPYAGFLRHPLGPGRTGSVHLLSSSPERFATVDAERRLEARPIKGTLPRGDSTAEDERHRRRLAQDLKNRAENLMIVDLLRNDLSMVCEVGSVEVPGLMEVESYANVHQLVSTIRGRLRGDVTTVTALRALFPAGSMTGAPKRRTMQIIDAVEAGPRGVYAGAFGWLGADGRADLSVVIRSLVATDGPGPAWTYELGTGGGVTVRSTLAEEYQETRWKAARVRAALR